MTVPFDSLALSCLVADLQAWRGARVRKIAQPAPTRLVLTLHHATLGETRWLFDCGARTARTHLIRNRPLSPDAAPAFCMAVRKYIEGVRLQSVTQLGFDRVLDAHFEGSQGTVTLRAELMGKHANLVLLDEEGKILAVAKPVTRRINRVRELLPNRLYAPPPRPDRPDPRTVSADALRALLAADAPTDFGAWLRDHFEGISPFLATELAARAADSDVEARLGAFVSVFAPATNHWQPVLLGTPDSRLLGAYPLPVQHWTASREPAESFSAALERAWDALEARAAEDAAYATLEGQLRRALRAREDAEREIEAGRKKEGRAAKWRHWGELLLAYTYQVEVGASTATLPDWDADEQPVSIPLDPTLTPQENAARLFKRASGAQVGRERLEAQAARVSEEAKELRSALSELQGAQGDQIAQLRERARERGWLHLQTGSGGAKSTASDFEGHKVRAFTSPDGYRVLVGENADANDYLVRHASTPNDWWLHARAGTSAHAIIKTNNHPEKVPPTTLRFAAENVARRSAGKHANVVAVDYTLRKYVRRPRGAAPGTVLRQREKTMDVSPHGEE